jgi:uncharacterized NAD(P)/FAD-binding protein YdhS
MTLQGSSTPEPTSARRWDVAIVGGGFAGIACAFALMRGDPTLRIAIMDPAQNLPAGLPFANARPEHLLNVRAAQLSIRSDLPFDFCDYLQRTHGAPAAEVHNHFAPRQVYAHYLAARLAQAKQTSCAALEHIPATVAAIGQVGAEFLLTTATTCERARCVILALGAGTHAAMLAHPRCYQGPWQLTALPEHEPQARALVIGSGLTGVDSVQSLRSLGWRGEIHWLAPHARLPQCSVVQESAAWPWPEEFLRRTQTPRVFLSALRAQLRIAAAQNSDWRAVIDALRPHTQSIFACWSARERLRALKRLVPIWSRYRHRAPPVMAAQFVTWRSDSKLHIIDARAQSARAVSAQSCAVQLVQKGLSRTEHYALVIDARGPNYGLPCWPLLSQLLQAGLVKASATGLGLQVAADGVAGEGVFALGAICYGERLETTAVPELRVQAEQIAQLVLRKFAG